MLSAAAVRRGVRLGVLVDIDVGQHRCGLPPGAAAVDLARQVVGTTGLELCGVMGYEGHVQPVAERAAREDAARTAMRVLDRGRLHISAVCVGIAERLIAEGVRYALERKQFGRSIGEFQDFDGRWISQDIGVSLQTVKGLTIQDGAVSCQFSLGVKRRRLAA